MSDLLTPTEDLFMEVLAARHRTGELIWTFDNRHKRTARRLEELDLVWWKSGITEDCFRAGLTPAGREAYLAAPYQTPIERANAR